MQGNFESEDIGLMSAKSLWKMVGVGRWLGITSCINVEEGSLGGQSYVAEIYL